MTPPIEELLRQRVSSLAPVAAIAGARVYLDKLPQSPSYPAVRVQFIDEPQGYHYRGPEHSAMARVQVDAMVQEASGLNPYTRASQLLDAINGDGFGPSATGIDGWIGTIGSAQVESIRRVVRRRDFDDDLRVVMLQQDYLVRYRG